MIAENQDLLSGVDHDLRVVNMYSAFLDLFHEQRRQLQARKTGGAFQAKVRKNIADILKKEANASLLSLFADVLRGGA